MGCFGIRDMGKINGIYPLKHKKKRNVSSSALRQEVND